MKESLITKLPTNELMNPSQKKKRKHRQVLDKLVLFLKCNQIHCFLCQHIPGNPHLAPICAHIPLSHRAAGWPLACLPGAAALAGELCSPGLSPGGEGSTMPGCSAALLREGQYCCPNSTLSLSSLT